MSSFKFSVILVLFLTMTASCQVSIPVSTGPYGGKTVIVTPPAEEPTK